MVGAGSAPCYVARLQPDVRSRVDVEAVRVATHEALAVARTLVVDTTLVGTFSGVSPPTNAPFSLVQRILWK